jgi:hypothetical protein
MILWSSQSDDHPKTNLAKFGYLLDMKVEKNQKPSIFLANSSLTWPDLTNITTQTN